MGVSARQEMFLAALAPGKRRDNVEKSFKRSPECSAVVPRAAGPVGARSDADVTGPPVAKKNRSNLQVCLADDVAVPGPDDNCSGERKPWNVVVCLVL